MNIKNETTPSRCPVCLRSRDEAIREQSIGREPCDNPNCLFRREIEDALATEERKPAFVFKIRETPHFKFGIPKKE